MATLVGQVQRPKTHAVQTRARAGAACFEAHIAGAELGDNGSANIASPTGAKRVKMISMQVEDSVTRVVQVFKVALAHSAANVIQVTQQASVLRTLAAGERVDNDTLTQGEKIAAAAMKFRVQHESVKCAYAYNHF